MGRPLLHKTLALQRLFELYNSELVVDGKVVSPKSQIWKEICRKISETFPKTTEKAVYTAALKWWNAVKTQSVSQSSFENLDISIMEKSTDSVESINSIDKVRQTLVKFKIELSAKVWDTISPVERLYARKSVKGVRSYKVLKPGVWTNVILDEITKKRPHIQCVWTFENNRCYNSGEDFLRLQAKCKVCSAIMCGVSEKDPDEGESLMLNLEIRGISSRLHEKAPEQKTPKTRIGGAYAKNLYAMDKPATGIVRNELKRKAKMFAKPYGRVPTANAIRCGKYRRRQKEKLSSDPYKALSYLKASNKYADTIHNIGMDNFYVTYSSPNQLKLFKAYKQKNRYTKLSCDATGGVANKLGKCTTFLFVVRKKNRKK